MLKQQEGRGKTKKEPRIQENELEMSRANTQMMTTDEEKTPNKADEGVARKRI